MWHSPEVQHGRMRLGREAEGKHDDLVAALAGKEFWPEAKRLPADELAGEADDIGIARRRRGSIGVRVKLFDSVLCTENFFFTKSRKSCTF
jgi:hypothetical protein